MSRTSGVDGSRTSRRASGPGPRFDDRPDARRARRVAAPIHSPSSPPKPRRPRSKVVLSALVMAFAAGLVATLALPSYAVNPAQRDSVEGRKVSTTGQQQYQADENVAAAQSARDTFKATSSATLLRRDYAAKFASYSGPSAADYVKAYVSNPAHPPFSLSAVYNTALQYIGVPYVFGGADPSGFDCSGFVMFVYAQYGVSLPHSVHAQDGIGTPISQADAQPGDIVIFNDDSHDAFYAGNGMILHAPYPGAKVRIQKLWTTDVHFERFGI